MKVLIDTNILISSALGAGGTPFLAYVKAVTHPNRAVVCEQNLDELRRVFNRKFPTKLYAMERFLALALTTIEVVPASSGGTGRASSSGGRQSTDNVAGIQDDDIFLRLTLSRTDVVVGEPITATLKLYQRVNIAGFEDARFPSFNGFWSQEVEAPTNIEFRRESYDNKIYNTAVLRKYVLIPQQTGTINIDPAELVCLVNIRVSSGGGASIFDGFFDDYRTIRKRVTSSSYKVCTL